MNIKKIKCARRFCFHSYLNKTKKKKKKKKINNQSVNEFKAPSLLKNQILY